MRTIAGPILAALLVVCCTAESEAPDPIPEPYSSRGLVVEQRPLSEETTLRAVGLRPEGSERQNPRWSSRCDSSEPIATEGAWKQRFRVSIQNDSMEALEFDASVAQYGEEETTPPKTRDLGRLVIPPLTEKRFSGFILSPRRPSDILCTVELAENRI